MQPLIRVHCSFICKGKEHMHWYSPHGGPLHCAHISSNYIKFDQGQKDIARFVALYIPDEVFKHLLRSSYEP